MTARNIRKNFVLFVDGTNYAGEATKVTPPKLVRKTEDFRAGGMDGSIKLDMGQEPMDASFTLSNYSKSVLALYGLAAGQNKSVVLREVMESPDGTVTGVVHTMRGLVTEMDSGESEAGKPGELTVAFHATYYKLQHGDTVVHEIDVPNMVCIVDGVDQLAKQRAALGM